MVFSWEEYEIRPLKSLIGANVTRVSMTEDDLIFETDKGNFHYTVDGDCCSWSYFYDFVGVEKLLANGQVTGVKTVELDSFEVDDWSETKCYGYQIFSEHPVWGEQTSVFSFRNDSNGYYGGSLGGPEIVDSVDENNLLTEHVHTVA